MTTTPCQSCTMPIESGPYCQYCVDAEGKLQPFAERYERMIQWTRRKNPELSAVEQEKKTLEFMATMPAWRDNPELAERLAALGL